MNIIPADDFVTGVVCMALAIFFIALLLSRKDVDDG